jgi:Zn-dependent protease
MFGRSWRIGTIWGIPVNVDSSWIWIAVLVTYSLWAEFNVEYVNIQSGTALGLAVFAAALFFGSVFLHEVAHAVAARLHGIKVFGITLVVFGGFTSARSDEKGPGPAFVISAVGPLTSLALGALFLALSVPTDASAPLSASFRYVGRVNLLLAGFNFLPGLPLDGGRMLEAAVWRISRNHELGTRIAAWSGMGLGALLLAGGLFEAVQGELFTGVWFAIIGLFIFQAARAAEAQIGLRRRMAQATVAEVMEPPPPPVGGPRPIPAWARGRGLPGRRRRSGDRDAHVRLGPGRGDGGTPSSRPRRRDPPVPGAHGGRVGTAGRGGRSSWGREIGAGPRRRPPGRRDHGGRRGPVGDGSPQLLAGLSALGGSIAA